MALAPLALPFLLATLAVAGPGERDVAVPIDWPGYRAKAQLVADPSPHYLATRSDGTVETLTPEDFARRTLDHERGRSPVEKLFNVSGMVGILWVLFGLAGQVVFAGRMVIQWLISERRKESVVPPIFWWMSLTGSAMLLSYFLWRQDIVGILGQSLGFVIYVRNLVLIRRSHLRGEEEADTTIA